MSRNQPALAVRTLITILASEFQAFDLSTNYIMPADHTQYDFETKKLDEETITNLTQACKTAVPCLANSNDKTIRESIKNAFKTLRDAIKKEILDVDSDDHLQRE